MTITVSQYFMGRDVTYKCDLTPQIQLNAVETTRRANLLLDRFYAANPDAYTRGVNSGWRPAAVNCKVTGAARLSNHMLAKAIDISDEDGELDKWCLSPEGFEAMTEIQLWLESPESTPRWCHVQIVPPGSGHRVFRP